MERRKHLNIIACIDENLSLGKDHTLIYHIKEDMKFFRDTTIGNVVIMGWRTYESLPIGPLQNRINIVITRGYLKEKIRDNLYYVSSLENGIELAESEFPDKEIFVIGGGKTYSDALNIFQPGDKMYLTVVLNSNVGADVRFPKFNQNDFIRAYSEIKTDIVSGLSYRFETYTCLKDYNKKKIFLSIPFTGYEDKILSIYNAMKEWLKVNRPEFEIVTQKDLLDIANSKVSHTGTDYNKVMLQDFELIENSDAVMFANGWENSQGCYAEWVIARLFKKELLYF